MGTLHENNFIALVTLSSQLLLDVLGSSCSVGLIPAVIFLNPENEDDKFFFCKP